MPRACALVNNAIVSTLVIELTTRNVCAVTIAVSVANLDTFYNLDTFIVLTLFTEYDDFTTF